MRILHIITDLQTGGAEKLMVDLLPCLRDLGNEVELLCIVGTRTPFYEELERQGIRIHHLSMGGTMYNPLHVGRLCRFLKKHHFDVVHTHNTPPQILAAVASKFVKAAWYTTEHNTSNRRRDWKWVRPIDRWMYGRYKEVVCISDKAEENLRAYLGDMDNVCTIYNGVDIDRYRQAVPDAELLRQGEGLHTAIMVASFRPQKDQPTIIRAYTLLPENFHVYFAGVGEREAACKQLAEQLGVAHRVHFLGMRTDIPALLKSVDVVMMSSHFEGLSLSSIEGMASGRPFVASDVDGLREVVAGNGLLFPHEDAQALADCIRKLAQDKALCAQVVARCEAKAAQYDIRLMARNYDALYRGE